MNNPVSNVAEFLSENFPLYLNDLKTLVKIPSISFSGFPPEAVKQSAEAVAELLRNRGLENVQILQVPGAHPAVYGERLKAPGKPTLLLYAHHDVQPVGREDVWETPPFTPTEKEGPKGLRLYGRGSADDKAGIIVHTSAIAAYLETVGELPVNVKVFIEGEEEVGSTHLAQFLNTYQKQLAADVLVLTDTSNFDCGVPALTVALRGLVGIEVEVQALSKTVHSGMWGGPIPDPAMGLAKALASLVDEQGQIQISGVLDQLKPIDEEEKKELSQIPYDESEFRKQSGMLPGVQFLKTDLNPGVAVWRSPSLTINALSASSRSNAGNIINDSAWAKVTLRLVDHMDPQDVLEKLQAHLKSHLPWGLHLSLKTEACHGSWSVEAKGWAFEAAQQALKEGYGKHPVRMGCGGSIPFVKPFAQELGGIPALLIGVEDPYTNAHGENESVLISDLKKACLSQVYLFSELAKRWENRTQGWNPKQGG
ncbi:MAG: M20/M25/M40 family metallo-hydrolase [Bdellovibrionia bacterium]